MRTSTLLWACWALAFVVIEAWAVLRGEYVDTLSGHVRTLMQSSGWLMVLVPTCGFALILHWILDSLKP